MPPRAPEIVSLNEILMSSERMLRILAGEDIRLELEVHAKECLIAVEPSKFEQILLNLVANSRDAMPHGGTITITVSAVDVDEDGARLYIGLRAGKHVKLCVADTGQGIPPEFMAQIFEPFFTTKEKGTGLGLSTVYGIVSQHEGHIGCHSAVDQGTTFTIFLPLAERMPVAAPRVLPPPKIRGGSEKVLLVEDEPDLRASVRRILEQNGYEVFEASDGAAALKISQGQADGFHLLITDIALPGMRGPELAERLLEQHPHMRVLYMSGYSGDAIAPRMSHFIPKPFRRDTLVRRVREVLDA